MPNNDYIRGYKQGYNAGKQLSMYALDTDIKYIAGHIALILHEKGIKNDEIVDVLTEMQKRWALGEYTPEEIVDKVNNELDIDIRVI